MFNTDMILPRTLKEIWYNKAINISIRFSYDPTFEYERLKIQKEINKNLTWNVISFKSNKMVIQLNISKPELISTESVNTYIVIIFRIMIWSKSYLPIDSISSAKTSQELLKTTTRSKEISLPN